MGGFVDPFIPSSAWPQDMVFAGLSSWAGIGASSLAGSSAKGMGFYHLQNGSSPAAFPAGGTALSSAELHEQLQLLQGDGLDFDDAGALDSILGAAPYPVSLMDSALVICSSNESSGSEQSGVGTCLPQFLMGAEHPAAWPPACLGSTAGPGDETSTQSFGFGGISGEDILHEAAACAPNGANRYQQLGAVSPAQLQLHDDAEFSSGKLLSFSPGQQVRPGGIETLQQMNQNEFSGSLHHLDLSSLVPGPQLTPFNPKQVAEDGKINGTVVAGTGGGAAPKPRARARRGQATDPHSIAERLRREKISDRMKNLQELVPNSNKTDKASMLEEIIEYIKFLQLQTKVLSMSRLGATEAVVPLLMESQDESSGLLLGSPRSRSQSDEDNATFEQEIAQLMENNMTLAMQYLQSKGLCLMPIGLASALSTQKGTASAAVQPENGAAAGIPTEIKFKTM